MASLSTDQPLAPGRVRNLRIEEVPVGTLKAAPNNPRTHSSKQIRQIARSIETFGWTNAVVIDGSGTIIAGHGRVRAATLLGIARIPVVRIGDMSPEEIRAYIIADNKLAENAGWDPELLALELQGLMELAPDLDVTITGFEMGEIDVLIQGLGATVDQEAERVPDLDTTNTPVIRIDDLWLLGEHRLLCADATKPESFDRLMGGQSAEMIFTDPPFNVPIAGNVSGLGAVRHSEFAMASGEMTEAEFIRFLESTLRLAAKNSVDGAIHFICMDWRHLYELLTVGRRIFAGLQNLCVWAKTNAGMGSLYRSQHELISVFKNGRGSHINNVELGRYGRNRSNVWSYRGMNSFGTDRERLLAQHPTVKPVALVEDAILDCSNRGGLVLDPFVGSGTTLIAAERTRRRGFGIEIDPRYCDVTLRRFRDMTGIDPVRAGDGVSFSRLERQRDEQLRYSREDTTAEDHGRVRRWKGIEVAEAMTSATANRRENHGSKPANRATRKAGRKASATSKATSRRRLRRRSD